MPGFLTPASMARVVCHLRDRCAMRGPNAVFCDVGCGQARPMLAAMEASPRLGGVVGFDVDGTTLLLAEQALARYRALRWTGTRYERGGGGDAAPPACVRRADVTTLEDLGCATHAHCFCFGMPADVLAHLFRACAATASLRYVVLVYKPAAGDAAKELVDELEAAGVGCHHFRRDDGKASALAMPGGTVPRGCCFRLAAARGCSRRRRRRPRRLDASVGGPHEADPRHGADARGAQRAGGHRARARQAAERVAAGRERALDRPLHADLALVLGDDGARRVQRRPVAVAQFGELSSRAVELVLERRDAPLERTEAAQPAHERLSPRHLITIVIFVVGT